MAAELDMSSGSTGTGQYTTGGSNQGSGGSVSNNPITIESAPLMFPFDEL